VNFMTNWYLIDVDVKIDVCCNVFFITDLFQMLHIIEHREIYSHKDESDDSSHKNC